MRGWVKDDKYVEWLKSDLDFWDFVDCLDEARKEYLANSKSAAAWFSNKELKTLKGQKCMTACKRILLYITQSPGCTKKELCVELNINYNTLSAGLFRLQRKEVVVAKPIVKSKAKLYFLKEKNIELELDSTGHRRARR